MTTTTTPTTPKRAIVLLSGGLDSAVAAAMIRKHGYELHAVSYEYGQRHRIERDYARRQAHLLGVASHEEINLGDAFYHVRSALLPRTFGDIPVPAAGSAAGLNPTAGPPATYVPGRNVIFLSVAAALAEVRRAELIVIGANLRDHAGYPDCRPAFIEKFAAMLHVGTHIGLEGCGPTIAAPLLYMDKDDIVRQGAELGVDFSATWSCYDPQYEAHVVGGVPGLATAARPCGVCDACQIRAGAFASAGLVDPARAP